ncbi:MAG: glycerophosphoryl diester phosphodiesterase membrane domain-containing protein [Planctomycetota bacterium]|nr:glycerophosphoryl diester phosphodiesterase membrane domain-containing protein [Planctomycetota bacterium]
MTFRAAARAVMQALYGRWKMLFLTDMLVKAVAFVLLAPLAAGLLQLSLWAAGSGTLADADILVFVLRPLGWLVLVGAGAVSLGIVAVEQATLLVVLMAPEPSSLSLGTAFGLAAARSRQILGLTAWLVGLASVVIAPFAGVAAVIALWLLGDYDINYYLAEQPPAFQAALACGAVLAAGLTLVLAWLASGWILSLPLVLFEGLAPRAALAESRRRTAGSRQVVVMLLLAWGLASVVISFLTTSAVVLGARQLVPLATGTLPRLVFAIGGTLAVWFAASLVVNLVTTVSFSAVLSEAYRRLSAVGHVEAAPLPAGRLSAAAGRLRLNRRRVAALLCVGCAFVATLGGLAARQVRFDDDVVVIGHRGAGKFAPENTRASVERAIVDGADWVEVDVQETTDGEVVVVHDSDFMKLAGVPLKVWEATIAEVEAVDVGSRFDPAFAGERVPTLAAVLEACRGRAGVTIELKDYGHGQMLEERVAGIVEACGMESDVVVMSLKPAVVKRMKSLRPDWTVGLLMSVSVGDASTLEADFLAVNARFVSRGFVRRAHRAGKQVFVWTTNDAVSISRMIGRGVDGVITDDPDLARRVIAQRAALSPVERVVLELAELLGVETSIGSQ